MDLLYRMGQASAQEIWEQLPDPPNYSAVRSLLALLEEKGLVRHTRQSKKYIFHPVISPTRARKGALRRLRQLDGHHVQVCHRTKRRIFVLEP